MSIREKLKEITEKARIEIKYSQEIDKFCKYILSGWIAKSVECASRKEDQMKLVAYDEYTTYEGVKIITMIKYGLLEKLKEKTELEVMVKEYIIDRDRKECIELINSTPFIGDNTFKHYYIIWLSWL